MLTKPSALAVRPEGIPQEMRDRAAWVCWDYRQRDGDWRKQPLQPTGHNAKSNDRSTWATFEAVLAASRRQDLSGVGLVFEGDGLVGVDLDDCIVDGQVEPWAQKLIDLVDSYSETSPSGTGVKVWCFATLPTEKTGRQAKYRTGAVEMYQRGRYFATTGHHLNGTPTTINEAQDAVDWLWNELFGEQRPVVHHQGNGRHRNGQHGHDDRAHVIERAAKYLAKIDPAVSGQGGHGQTFHVACVLILGFDLTDGEAWPLIAEWNGRCQPPWGEHDLRRKLDEADKQAGERGYLRDASRNGDGGDLAQSMLDSLPAAMNGEGKKRGHYNQTDLGNAERFIDQHGQNVRFCFLWAKWLVWDNRRWRIDDTGAVQRLAAKTARSIYREASQGS